MPRGKTLRPIAVPRGAPDHQLLELARAGSTEAFDEIVARYRPRLLRYCAGLTRPERVDDAVQHALMNAWLALGRGAEVRELRPWLFSIARNAAIDQLRLHRGELVELSAELAGGSDPAAVAVARGEIDDVLRAVSELPERQRTALMETAVHGRPTELVADEMGMSGGALRQLVHRARTNVKGMVASLLPSPALSWFAQLGGEEGTRRLAVLVGGAGQSATAAALAATATVASVGALGTAGIGAVSQPERPAQTASSEVDTGSRAKPTARAWSSRLAPTSLVTLPISAGATAIPAVVAPRADADPGGAVGSSAPAASDEDAARRGGSRGGADVRSERDAQAPGRHGDEAARGSGRPGSHDHTRRSGRSGSSEDRSARSPLALAAHSGPRAGQGGGGAGRRPHGSTRDADAGERAPVEATAPAAASAPAAPVESVAPQQSSTVSDPGPEPAPAPEVDQSTVPGGDGTAGSSSPMSSS